VVFVIGWVLKNDCVAWVRGWGLEVCVFRFDSLVAVVVMLQLSFVICLVCCLFVGFLGGSVKSFCVTLSCGGGCGLLGWCCDCVELRFVWLDGCLGCRCLICFGLWLCSLFWVGLPVCWCFICCLVVLVF